MIGTMVYAYYDILGDEVTTTNCYDLENRKVKQLKLKRQCTDMPLHN